MAHESRWRTESNRVILAALESGRAAGLEGRAMELHVWKACPFPDNQGRAYQVFKQAAERLVWNRHVPLRGSKAVFGLRPPEDTPMFPDDDRPRVHEFALYPGSRNVWWGETHRGDSLVAVYADGRLTVRVGSTLWASRHARPSFDERICGPKDPPPAPSEVAVFLSGLFDFGAIDLAALDGAEILRRLGA